MSFKYPQFELARRIQGSVERMAREILPEANLHISECLDAATTDALYNLVDKIHDLRIRIRAVDAAMGRSEVIRRHVHQQILYAL